MDLLFQSEIHNMVEQIEEMFNNNDPVRMIDDMLVRFADAIKQLEAEGRIQKGTKRVKILASVQRFKKDISRLRTRLDAARLQSDRNALMSTGRMEQEQEEKRELLTSMTKRMEEGTSSLASSHTLMMEIEGTARKLYLFLL